MVCPLRRRVDEHPDWSSEIPQECTHRLGHIDYPDQPDRTIEGVPSALYRLETSFLPIDQPKSIELCMVPIRSLAERDPPPRVIAELTAPGPVSEVVEGEVCTTQLAVQPFYLSC